MLNEQQKKQAFHFHHAKQFGYLATGSAFLATWLGSGLRDAAVVALLIVSVACMFLALFNFVAWFMES